MVCNKNNDALSFFLSKIFFLSFLVCVYYNFDLIIMMYIEIKSMYITHRLSTYFNPLTKTNTPNFDTYLTLSVLTPPVNDPYTGSLPIVIRSIIHNTGISSFDHPFLSTKTNNRDTYGQSGENRTLLNFIKSNFTHLLSGSGKKIQFSQVVDFSTETIGA